MVSQFGGWIPKVQLVTVIMSVWLAVHALLAIGKCTGSSSQPRQTKLVSPSYEQQGTTVIRILVVVAVHYKCEFKFLLGQDNLYISVCLVQLN